MSIHPLFPAARPALAPIRHREIMRDVSWLRPFGLSRVQATFVLDWDSDGHPLVRLVRVQLNGDNYDRKDAMEFGQPVIHWECAVEAELIGGA